MARKPSRQSFEKRIYRSIQSFHNGDMEEALYNIAPLIDVVAKIRYKTKTKVGERIKGFINDEQDLIYFLSTQGKIPLKHGVKLILCNEKYETLSKKGGELSDFIYHYIRCAQSHDAEIDYDHIDLGRHFGIGHFIFKDDGGPLDEKKFVISSATVIALILSVISAKETPRIKLTGAIQLFGKISIILPTAIGNKSYVMEALKDLFKKKDKK